MKYIDLIKQYWSIVDALRVVQALKQQSDKSIYSEYETKLSAELVVVKKCFVDKPNHSDVMAELPAGVSLVQSVDALMQVLNADEAFNESYKQKKLLRLSFSEILETERTFVSQYNRISVDRSRLEKVIKMYFAQFVFENDDGRKSLSLTHANQMTEYLNALKDYEIAKSSLVLTVQAALTLTSEEKIARWLEDSLFQDSFFLYLEQIQKWASHFGKWNVILTKMSSFSVDHDLENELQKAIQHFNAAAPGAFQRLPRYSLFAKELNRYFEKCQVNPEVITVVQSIERFLQMQTVQVNRAVGESNVAETYHSELVKAQQKMTELLEELNENYPYFYDNRGLRIFKITKVGLHRIAELIDSEVIAVNNIRGMNINENIKTVCELLQNDLSSSLSEEYRKLHGRYCDEERLATKAIMKITAVKEVFELVKKLLASVGRTFEEVDLDAEKRALIKLVEDDDNHDQLNNAGIQAGPSL